MLLLTATPLVVYNCPIIFWQGFLQVCGVCLLVAMVLCVFELACLVSWSALCMLANIICPIVHEVSCPVSKDGVVTMCVALVTKSNWLTWSQRATGSHGHKEQQAHTVAVNIQVLLISRSVTSQTCSVGINMDVHVFSLEMHSTQQ